MWLETMCAPLKDRLGKLLIWFDNCGCHKTAIVEISAIFEAMNDYLDYDSENADAMNAIPNL